MGKAGILGRHALERDLPYRQLRQVDPAQVAAQQPQQVDQVAWPIALLGWRLAAPGV